DAVLRRHPDRAAHHDRVAGMKAAGDIGRGDELQHRGVVADRIGAEALAHVAVQVDLLSHSASSRGIIFIIFSSLSGLFRQPRLRGLTGAEFEAHKSNTAGIPKFQEQSASLDPASIMRGTIMKMGNVIAFTATCALAFAAT